MAMRRLIAATGWAALVNVAFGVGNSLADPEVQRYLKRVGHVILDRPLMYRMAVIDGTVQAVNPHTRVENCYFRPAWVEEYAASLPSYAPESA